MISINHAAGVEEMPVKGALRFRHTYEGQPNVVNQGLGVLVGLVRTPQQWLQKVSVAVEPHVGMPPNLVDAQIVE